ncbi:MAG: FAD-dependent oxidoreductase, partial [Firmicutes bacterium]|nr:FAD-dependent oxidoreductase [Bacillota bacterium]
DRPGDDGKHLNRVVVASCTIRTHQPLFREALRDAGLNQFLFEMANIREQDSWVHRDNPALATAKAKDLVKMAVAKVKEQEPLYTQEVPVLPRALIVGGGAAGLTAAAAFADQGIESYVIEREAELGGFLRRLRTTPEGQDLGLYLQGLLRRVDEDPLIHVYNRAEVMEVSGHAGHFKTTIALPGRSAGSQLQLEHGVIIIATGAVESRPNEYLYGEDPRVLTQTELENRLADGNRQGLDRLAMIQCVGSRDDNHRYCSRTCCTQAVKNALTLKRANPAAEVYVLYRDIRTYGLLEKFYKEAREEGVLFLRYDEGQKPRVTRNGEGLSVEVIDQTIGQPVSLGVDAVVLAAAAEPPSGIKDLASTLKIPLNEDGFFMETHAKLGPMDFPSQGIYMAGAAHSPKFLAEAVYQAQGAVARAMNVLSQKNLTVGGVVAVVEEDKCAACLTCVRVCPFSVPFINERRVAEINPVQCHGCGSCAAECPAQAIQLQNYKDTQVLAKIRGLFELTEVGG